MYISQQGGAQFNGILCYSVTHKTVVSRSVDKGGGVVNSKKCVKTFIIILLYKLKERKYNRNKESWAFRILKLITYYTIIYQWQKWPFKGYFQ